MIGDDQVRVYPVCDRTHRPDRRQCRRGRRVFGPCRQRPHRRTADGEPALDVVMAQEFDVNGLQWRINRVVVQRDRMQVEAILHNPGDAPYSLLLGGCGPSQGRVTTGDGWREVYQQVQSEGDWGGLLGPGASRRGTTTLKPTAVDPKTVTRLQLHPGYGLNATTGSGLERRGSDRRAAVERSAEHRGNQLRHAHEHFVSPVGVLGCERNSCQGCRIGC